MTTPLEQVKGMKENHYKLLEPLMELADQKIGQLLESSSAKELAAAMQEVSAGLPDNFEVQLNVGLVAFEPERGTALPLTTQMICSIGGQEPYLAQADSTVQRYVVEGEICQVPHDRCPKCWDLWEAKFVHEECTHCGAKMGEDVKLLIDSDLVPIANVARSLQATPSAPNAASRLTLTRSPGAKGTCPAL